jgi:hypothetical protein
MKLNDAKRLAVRSRLELKFETASGAVCVIGKDGVARLPDLGASTTLKISDEFDRAAHFVICKAGESRRVCRSEVESLCGGHATETVEHHDE